MEFGTIIQRTAKLIVNFNSWILLGNRWIRRTWAISPNPTTNFPWKKIQRRLGELQVQSDPKELNLPQKTMTWGWLALATGNYADLRGRFENDFPGALLWQIGAPL